jgi:hypothetical protein
MARKRRKKKLTRTQRLRRRFDKDPFYNPTVQLSGWRLRNAAHRLADFQFGPQRSELGRESASVTRQGGALLGHASDYYHQLAAEEAQGVARQAALSGQTNAQLAQLGAQAQGQVTAAQGQQASAVAADAAQRGQGLQGTNTAADELAAARASAAQSAQGFRSAGVLQGANYQGLAAATRSAGMLKGGEVQGELANRIATAQGDIRSKQQDLEAQYGSAVAKNVTDLRQQGFENIATQEGLGLKGQQLQADIAQNQADEALARGRLSETSRANKARERIAKINSRIAAGNLTERQRHDLETEKQGHKRILKGTSGGAGGGAGGHSKKWRTDYHKAIARIHMNKHGRWQDRIREPGWRQRYVDALVASGLNDNAVRTALHHLMRQARRSRTRRDKARFGPH